MDLAPGRLHSLSQLALLAALRLGQGAQAILRSHVNFHGLQEPRLQVLQRRHARSAVDVHAHHVHRLAVDAACGHGTEGDETALLLKWSAKRATLVPQRAQT